MSFSCKYKERYFLSWLLGAMILGIIFIIISLFTGIEQSDPTMQSSLYTLSLIHIISHICYVLFSDNTQCRDDKCKACANSCGLTYTPSK